jgi:hypothetical protein
MVMMKKTWFAVESHGIQQLRTCIPLPLEERRIYRSNWDIQYERHHSYKQATSQASPM